MQAVLNATQAARRADAALVQFDLDMDEAPAPILSLIHI